MHWEAAGFFGEISVVINSTTIPIKAQRPTTKATNNTMYASFRVTSPKKMAVTSPKKKTIGEGFRRSGWLTIIWPQVFGEMTRRFRRRCYRISNPGVLFSAICSNQQRRCYRISNPGVLGGILTHLSAYWRLRTYYRPAFWRWKVFSTFLCLS